MKKSRIYLISLVAILAIVLIWIFSGTGPDKEVTIKVPVKYGKFDIVVTTTGELEAKSSEKIMGPVNLRDFRIWQIKIEDIIPDGTVVDSGNYIASLDRSELVNKLKDQELEIEKLTTQFTKTQLDTTMDLRTARDNLINLKYALEERQIVVDQSIYEPPATQRQARIELERAQRNYEQAIENYQVKLQKARADMQEINTAMRKAQSEYAKMVSILGQFTIYAPKSGMVIYRRTWDGQKQGIGASVSVWDPVVAELPNLREMKSKTYVNEIDISKVRTGQHVRIGVDAFPDKRFTGVVTEVANIGQQLPNSNAKVFEVIIEVNEFDTILRPAMTTKNEILTSSIDSVFFIPLDCVQSNDTMSYVYTPNARKQVILGQSNENEVIIRAGLTSGEEIYLVPPSNAESYRLTRLPQEILDRFKQEEEEQINHRPGPGETPQRRSGGN
ncbi:MAG: efflux RND transporter periplasmic adaptor subunit [Bacteroidales bacterium]|nr:efflux RND transporter periplasmic adaptor subunit [Bacteroidales bacterium]